MGNAFPALGYVHVFSMCENMYYFFIQGQSSYPKKCYFKKPTKVNLEEKKDERTDIFLRLFAVFQHPDVSWKIVIQHLKNTS